ncbi:P-loop NTPase family protein [Caproicibacter fermentans]|uniref:Uncharacterized protein n=1 Tax=Caproicibacter fermentans TaxID=2576756 RepID=A0A7G8TC56_9FIRM|nr:hypothetical protein [Caproicibacter fermentans]QNK41197.1 hypothetical protein HCR03_02490 [Caproicibacter fermentans]
MRIPVALYPYCSQLLPIVKTFEELQSKYALKRLISPPGFGLIGKDAGYASNQITVGMNVDSDCDFSTPEWEVLFVIKTVGSESISDELLENVIKKAIQSNKSVAMFDNECSSIPEYIRILQNIYPDKIETHMGNLQKPVSCDNADRSTYYHFNVPVILVGGLVEEADTLEVLLHLASEFRKSGTFPSVITNSPLADIFGFHNITPIFQKHDLTESQKISELNFILHGIQDDERPDVILMEAPDAVIRYNDFALNGFGIHSYMLCQAIDPDYFICCVPCELAVGNFLDALSADFTYRLGCPIHAAHVSNLIIDSLNLIQTHQISYIHADLKTVRQQIMNQSKGSSIPLFNVVDDQGEALYQYLCEIMTI